MNDAQTKPIKDVTINIQSNLVVKETSPADSLVIAPPPKQVHILLVDDDDALRRLFGGYLKKAGFEVIYAADGNEGRETARRLQPDLILLDLTLPVMDGYEVSARLKQEALTKDIPVIILTNADISEESERAFKERGVDDYIHKSVQENELVDRVKKVLAKQQGNT